MYTQSTDIQEITLQAYIFGALDILMGLKYNMSRDEAFNVFEEWAKEFEAEADKHLQDPNWFYYDEVDAFIQNKIAEL